MIFDSTRNGAVVVAHPDDESLWFGGLLARYSGRWTVICCSIPRADPVRAWKFYDACSVFGAMPRLLPFVEPASDIHLQTLDILDLNGFDTIVTHNAVGEYGHRHHIDVHRYVAAHWPDRMFVTGYGQSIAPTEMLNLNFDETSRKSAAIRCYDHTSPRDGKVKWRALLERYSTQFDLSNELYVRHST